MNKIVPTTVRQRRWGVRSPPQRVLERKRGYDTRSNFIQRAELY